MISIDRYLLFMLALSIVVPRLPLVPIGLLGLIRLDHLIIILTLPAIIYKILLVRLYFILAVIFTIIFTFGENTYESFGHSVGAIYSILFIIQCIIFVELGGKLAHARDLKKIKIIYFALLISVSVGFVSRFTGFRMCSEYLHGNIVTSPCWLDQYGFSGAPYVFGAHAVGFMFISLILLRMFPYLVGLISLILGDSRAYFGAFVPASIWQLMKAKLSIAVFLPLALPGILLTFSNVKAIKGFTLSALTDRSLGMRLDNYANFMEWLTLKRLLFGDGYAAYLDFAVQYGQPGHPDNLYIRVISEIGVIGLAAYFLAVVTVFLKLKLRLSMLTLIFILGVLVLGLVQESHLANKSGQMLGFLLGLSFINLKNKRRVL